VDNCIFCKIGRGEIPAKKAYEDEDVVAFHDIHPQRPLHLLVIPKKHIESLAHVVPEDQAVLGKMLLLAHQLAAENGSQEGFRSIINTGRVGGQEVMHVHMHIVGGPDPVGPMLKRI
jgi:histidine triad (HIT) family protein